MKKTSYILAFLTAASALLLSSCARTAEPEGKGEGYVTFSTELAGEAVATADDATGSKAATKAAQINSISKFSVTAWNNGDTDKNAFISGYKEFALTAGKATTDIRWKKPYAKVFYAYANLPADGASVTSSTYEGQTLTYTVPEDAANQNDILMGVYSGDGGTNATASIDLDHPLTAVVFKVGDFTNIKNVKKISIDGVYASGSVTQAADGTFAAWTGTTSTQTVKQESASGFSISGDIIGVPFILIPQTNANGLKVEMVLTLTDDSELTCTGTLGGTTSGGVVWEAGKTTTYTINYENGKGLNFSTPVVTAWGAGDSMTAELEEEQQPNNEIWYKTENGSPITLYRNDVFGATFVSNTYENGKGIIKFNGDVTTIGNYAMYDAAYEQHVEIWLPNTVSSIGQAAFDYWCYGHVHFNDILNSSNVSYKAFDDAGSREDSDTKVTTSRGTFNVVHGTVIFADGSSMGFDTSCFAKGSLISLSDGSKKPVEEITYTDELKVWNFDNGKEDSARILWITKSGLKADHYFRCTFSDGSTLDVVGPNHAHRLFNYDDKFFEGTTDIKLGTEIFTEHGIVTLASCERIDEEVEYYNLITDKDINCYANEVLTSCRYSNIYPIDEDMKFVKDGRKIRPYKEFKAVGISREWYNGMRLGEQTYPIEDIEKYIKNCEAHMAKKPAPTFWQRLKTWWKSIFG